MRFRSSLILPDKEIIVRETTLEAQLNLTKSILQEEIIGLEDFIGEHLYYDGNLNIVEVLLGLIYCREISAGDVLLLAKDSATYEIHLDRWKRLLYAIFDAVMSTSVAGYNVDIELCEWRAFLRGEFLYQISEIDGKKVKGEELPVKLYHSIHRHLKQTPLPKMDLLKPLNDWNFDFTPKSVWYLLSLLFQRDLESTYETMFILQKECNMECKTLTPGEFMFFSKQYHAMVANRQQPGETEPSLEDFEDDYP